MQKMKATKLGERLAEIASSHKTPRLLLHCCCAPCASYVLEYLSQFFSITSLFYNPNILPGEEYSKRAGELKKLLSIAKYPNGVDAVICDYEPAGFIEKATPFWSEPEGGRRCRVCFLLRLEETAKRAKIGGYDFFTTTLTVSPIKDAALLNETGVELSKKHGVEYLQSDFKKQDGYKRSVELSKHYGLYRQSYCGCGWRMSAE